MTNEQLFLAIGVPLLFNGLLMGLVFGWFNSRFTAMEGRMTALESRMTNVADSLNAKLDLMVGALHDLDLRVSRLEDRMERR